MIDKLIESKKIKIFTIMTTGRTGSDYLASCLDGVNGVIVFSGKFDHTYFFKDSIERKNQKTLIYNFLKKKKNLLSYDKIEDIDKNININNFKDLFLKISKKKMNSKEFLLKLYETYHTILNRKFKNIRALVHHSHGLKTTKSFIKDFPECGLLITIRDPRANLKSGLESWWYLDVKYKTINHIFFYLKRIRNDFNFALKVKNKKIFIKLEESNLLKTKKKICNFLNIKFDKKMMVATIASKIWNGDKLSKFKSSKGLFNSSVLDNGWKTFFKKKEVMILDMLYQKYRRYYNIKKISFFDKFKLFFYIFLPFNCEILILKNNIFNIKFLFDFYIMIKKILYLQLVLFNIAIK